ncbi:zinc ribbon domain-containing protein [Cohnella cholangitidis]|uniref:DUF4878 domain-containing protein n=1 Tax=Cohnella cholangitidis TaxID=2598458 RepID=A0A7G5C155_9BACL|nr:zinc ribbon domain-containing protein [Cohnella cholangitidis]QMV42939.1 DUF4878 domain-containing protein [Cohnella cholangitidis]
MYCSNCGEKLIASAISCPTCGFEVRPVPPMPEAKEAPVSSEEQRPSLTVQRDSYSYGLSNQSKKLILVALGAIAIVYLIFKFAGGDGSQATPEKTVKGFMNAVKQEDAKKMVSYMSISTLDLPEGDGMDSFIEMLERRFEDRIINLRDYDIKDVDIDEQTATVDYELEYTYDDEKFTEDNSFDLVKIKGKWFISGGLDF